ncbi:hypothetical protein [Streptomyces violascens]|uniref:Uncharacterized protein n=1 Tax=Streptomyces violascens TaxID=67381 RepID=A0ABQ3QXN6_9ACTN|nr:hypothetical protein [Streptomyces violascens]GGU17941.1 hypothetical protein GCM10010289_44490 [Streptomyces violascens]GHI42041.1 hypothetical protein Sviol_64490 [Streptomyces violascens]
MGEVLKRRPALKRLAIAAFGLMMLAVSSWLLSEVVGADYPRRPVWDVGSAGPWVASYARAIAAGSWMAARACLMLAALLLALDFASLLVGTIRRATRKPDRPVP